MKIKKIEKDLYEVVDPDQYKKWWTVFLGGDEPFITSGTSDRTISAGGALGKKLVRSVNDWLASHK